MASLWTKITSLLGPAEIDARGPKKRGAAAAEAADSNGAKKARLFGGDSTTGYCLDDDGDDDDPSDNEPLPPSSLHWRTAHPDLSDYIIEVVGSKAVDTRSRYNVHKSVLVLESKYFQTKFASQKIIPAASSRFVFPNEAALDFAAFLDYIYSPGTLCLTGKNAAAFHFFGRYFGLSHLRWAAKQFWTADLNFDTVAMYYQDAIVFDDHKIMDAVQEYCSDTKVLLRFCADSAIVKVPDPRLWMFLLEKVGPAHSGHLSVLIAAFCSRNAVADSTFLQLTNPEKLPVFASSAALAMLDQEWTILGSANEAGRLSSIQERGLSALEQDWSGIDTSKPEVTKFLGSQSPVFLVELFKRSLSAAQAAQRAPHCPSAQEIETPSDKPCEAWKLNVDESERDIATNLPADEPEKEEADATTAFDEDWEDESSVV